MCLPRFRTPAPPLITSYHQRANGEGTPHSGFWKLCWKRFARRRALTDIRYSRQVHCASRPRLSEGRIGPLQANGGMFAFFVGEQVRNLHADRHEAPHADAFCRRAARKLRLRLAGRSAHGFLPMCRNLADQRVQRECLVEFGPPVSPPLLCRRRGCLRPRGFFQHLHFT